MSKVSDSMAVLRIEFQDEDGQTKVLMTHNYEWNDQFDTLVAVECEQVKEYVPTEIKDVCTTSIQTASQVLMVMVNASAAQSEDLNLPKTVECIKQRTIETLTEETQYCFIQVLEKGTENLSAKMAAKISQLEAQGFTCDADGNCKKEMEDIRETRDELMDRDTL